MKVYTLTTALLGVASATFVVQPPQFLLENSPAHDTDFRIPTERESAAMARKILHLTTTGTLVTSFPSDAGKLGRAPPEIAGAPIGLMEYYADCDATSGNPILVALDIATPYRNYNAGSNISLGVRWWPKHSTTYSAWGFSSRDIPTPHTPAALPRFSLHGRLEPVSLKTSKDLEIQRCFLQAHPDSIYWQPGNDIHESKYVQLVVEQVYWFGGFGDRARIGWLPIEHWRNLTMEEVMQAKLPGEKKDASWWKEWL